MLDPNPTDNSLRTVALAGEFDISRTAEAIAAGNLKGAAAKRLKALLPRLEGAVAEQVWA